MRPEPKLAAFVLALVGGVLAVVDALRGLVRFGPRDPAPDALLLLGGALAVVGAMRGEKGQPRDGGVLGVVAGALILVFGSDLAGALALVGGVLFLVA